jgi:alpha-glucuronidase
MTFRVRFVRLLSVRGLALALGTLALTARAGAETGYDLWLRYQPIEDTALRDGYRKAISSVVVYPSSPTGRVISRELERGLNGLLGVKLSVAKAFPTDGSVLVVATPSSSQVFANQPEWRTNLDRLGAEGYFIRSMTEGGRQVMTIGSTTDVGALYGAFHLLRLIQTRQPIDALDLAERPKMDRRVLNHWDNLDGTIERGYAGRSLWNWEQLPALSEVEGPGRTDPRVEDYARANASLGINGTAINSVNANPLSLTRPYLEKAAALARAFRPYGIRVYLSANFAAPRSIGGLPTADPLHPAVARWWRDKAAEIYGLIPDLGGFVVKANSEGQPGPQDYKRTHADGANVLADAVAPHGGVVMWRAFVYDAEVDPDRVKRAYKEFVPLDGKFRANVLVQVKNGPLDFQPREPFSPLFGAMRRTPLLAELQITQEYLGHSTHLVYLAPMWREFFDAIEVPAGVAGVANTGSDRNWTGHDFGQANWYAYGRLAWDPALDAAALADEWIRMTWSHAPDVVSAIRSIMMDSRETFVSYTMPLGLHHLIGGDHYAPMPENPDPRRADWSAIYYHRADESGIGFDRTTRGSGAVEQYRPPLNTQWNDPKTTPDNLLLWFHRLPWDYRMRSGRTLWEELVRQYTTGAEAARDMESRWKALHGRVDDQRHEAVLRKLRQQAGDAGAWRDKCLRYFQQFSKRPLSSLPDRD